MEKVFVVIAAYNEEQKIGKVLDDLKGYEVIVVDDGSQDDTYKIAAKHKVHLLQHMINRGQGAALATGIEYALEEGADIIVTFDADGQYLAKEIPHMIRPIKEKKAEIVLGSRFLGKAVNIPKLKRLVLRLGIVVVYILYGMRVTDSQSGFRAMSRKAANTIDIRSDRMDHASDFFAEIMKHKLKYKEIPITVIYDKYALGKGQPWTNSFGLGLKMLYNKLTRK